VRCVSSCKKQRVFVRYDFQPAPRSLWGRITCDSSIAQHTQTCSSAKYRNVEELRIICSAAKPLSKHLFPLAAGVRFLPL